MRVSKHLRKMAPVLIEGLIVGSIFTLCIVFIWSAVQLVVGYI